MQKFLSYYYSLVCVLSPIFILYSFNRSSITMTDTFILLFYILYIPTFLVKLHVRVISSYFFLFVYVFLFATILLLINNDKGIYLRTIRILNYVLFLSLFHKDYFNSKFAEKCLQMICVISTTFLVIQHVAKSFWGMEISGILFPQYSLVEYDLENQIQGTQVYRLSSIFSEPASYGCYTICGLTHSLFYSQKVNMRIISLLCLGCVLSTSTTAVAGMALLMGLFIYQNKLFKNRNTLLLIIALITIYYLANSHVDAINSRISSGRSYNGRFHGYDVMLNLVDNPLFGIGFVSPSDIGVYLAGFARLFVYLGAFGVAVYALVYLNIFFSTQKKILLLVFLFLNLGSDTFFSISILYYSSFFLVSDNCAKSVKSYKNINRHNLLQQQSRT